MFAGVLPPSAERKLPNYRTYSLSQSELVLCLAVSALVLFSVGMLFYNHAFMSLVLSLAALWTPPIRKEQLAAKRRDKLKLQFKQALYALSTALGAGKSVESAFRECIPDLRLLYSDDRTMIICELDIINRRVELGEPLEAAIRDFGERSGIPDIVQFAEVFSTCKRTGGDLVEVMRRTAQMIGEKLEIEQDIAVLLAQKRFEARAIGIVPFGIVAFLAWGSHDYMEPLYSGGGRLVMTAALFLLGLCLLLIRKLMHFRA